MATTHIDTVDRLLDAAEMLFAEHGVSETSLRTITAAAGANLASVNYHFGSKEALLDAVFRRRIEPINAARMERLEALRRAGALEIEGIVDAFIGPPLEMFARGEAGNRHFPALMGRLYSEPGDRKMHLVRQFDQVFEAFVDALHHALPQLPPPELLWGLFHMVGTMAFYLVAGDLIAARSGGVCDPSDVENNRHRMVAFISAGIRAQCEGTVRPDRGETPHA